MGEYRSMLSDWSWGENKLFELALAVIDEKNTNRWELVAAMVGGRSAEEVEKHYRILLEDLKSIESGNLDHRFGDAAQLCLSTQSVCWTDEDQKMLVQLNVN